MACGYFGKLLFIDLKTKTWKIEEPDEQLYRDYLGGYALVSPIMYERMKPGADPFGPENILSFVPGLFTGTRAHAAGRFMVVAKSPATGGWGDSNCGGKFAPYLKATGFDAILIEGISPEPVYVSVYNDEIKFHDARHLWGMDACEAELRIREEVGKEFQVALIGQAGENKSCIAGVFNDQGRAAGRMGLGGVMGSKNLKAIACGGTFITHIADADLLADRCKIMSEEAKEYFKKSPLANYGTTVVYAYFMGMNDTAVKNWKEAASDGFYSMEQAMGLSADVYIPFRKKRYACSQCSTSCGAVLDVKDSEGNEFESHRPEYETIGSFGSNCLVDDLTSILEANEACNRYGFDSISAGCTIAWAMECNEHGLFTEEELDGFDLSWGNGKIFKELLRRMAYREGFLGSLLADGMKVAYTRLGRGSEAFRTDAGGIELPMHDPRCWPGFGLSYSTDAGPGRHTIAGLGFFEHAFIDHDLFEAFPEFSKLQEKRFDYDEDKGPAQRYTSAWIHVLNAMGFCSLSKLGNYPNYKTLLVLKAITGWEMTMDEALVIGERIQTIRHMFNLREGLRPHIEFRLPPRTIGDPPLTTGPTAGVTSPVDKYFDDYYRAMDIDPITARPSDARLDELGIKDLINKYWATIAPQ